VRRLAARAHLWGGLLLGPVVLVLGLSGAALVFRAELDAPPAVTPGPARALDAIAAAALLTEPGGEIGALRIPVRADRPYRLEIVHGARQVDVLVDPVTLRVLESRAPERSVFAAVRSLHAGFHAGRLGALAVALIGVALAVESVTGLWLYGLNPWRRVAGARGRSRCAHRLVGAASLPVGFVIGVTGVPLALAGAGGAAAVPTAPGLARLDALAAEARRVVPGGTLVTLLAASHDRVRAELHEPTGGLASVDLERTTAAVVTLRPSSARGAWELVRRAHYGDFGGSLTRVVWVLAGLAVPALTITGYLAATRRRHRELTAAGDRRERAARAESSDRAPSRS